MVGGSKVLFPSVCQLCNYIDGDEVLSLTLILWRGKTWREKNSTSRAIYILENKIRSKSVTCTRGRLGVVAVLWSFRSHLRFCPNHPHLRPSTNSDTLLSPTCTSKIKLFRALFKHLATSAPLIPCLSYFRVYWNKIYFFTSHTATYPGRLLATTGCRLGENTDQRRSQVYMIWESEGTFELMLCDRILSVDLEMTQAASLFQQS